MVNIGAGHLIRALQISFGHEEVMAMLDAVCSGNFSNINFCTDVYTEHWDESLRSRLNAPITEDD